MLLVRILVHYFIPSSHLNQEVGHIVYSHSTTEKTKPDFGEFAEGHKPVSYLKILESNLDHYLFKNAHSVY